MDTILNIAVHGNHLYATSFSWFGADIDFGAGLVTGSPVAVRFTLSGATQWSDGWDGLTFNDLTAGDGAALLCGGVRSSTTIDGVNLSPAGSEDALLLKMFDGVVQSYVKPAGAGEERCEEVAISPLGDVYIAGRFDSSITLTSPLSNADSVDDLFIAKYSAAGGLSWSVHIAISSSFELLDAAPTPDGGVVLVGGFEGAVTFGNDVLQAVGGTDVFVAKLSADGTFDWSRQFGDGGALQRAEAVAVDSISGAIVIGGSNDGTVDFGGGLHSSVGDDDAFVAKLSAEGGYVWSKQFGDSSQDWTSGIAVDLRGNVVVAATSRGGGTLDMGGGPLGGAGQGDAFVAKYSAGGAHLWSQRFGDVGDQTATDIRVDDAGNIYLALECAAAPDFGGGSLPAFGLQDVCLASYTP